MLKEIQAFYDELFKDLKKYIQDNSINKPYVFKQQPKEKLFPLVIVKETPRSQVYTTLSYTDTQYTFSLEIELYSLTSNNVSGKTVCKELSDLIEKYFTEVHRMNVKINNSVPNIDADVDRSIIYINCTLDTKYKDKLIIYPR